MDLLKGFSLIELIIALAILGLLAAIVVPNMRSLFAQDQRQVFLTELNSIVSNALDNAILTAKPNRVVFDFVNKTIFVEERSDKKLVTGEFGWDKISNQYVQSEFDWSKISIEVKNFYIDTKDEMKLGAGQIKKEKVWFFISEEGVAQPVVLNLIELDENLSQADSQFSLVLNPFSVQFKMYEKFMQPT